MSRGTLTSRSYISRRISRQLTPTRNSANHTAAVAASINRGVYAIHPRSSSLRIQSLDSNSVSCATFQCRMQRKRRICHFTGRLITRTVAIRYAWQERAAKTVLEAFLEDYNRRVSSPTSQPTGCLIWGAGQCPAGCCGSCH